MPSAIKRALRSLPTNKNSYSAAILGQNIATALSTIETAVLAIDAVNDSLSEAAGLVTEASKTDNLARRALLAGRFDDVRSEIDATVGSATHNRVNLINGRLIGGKTATFEVPLDMEARSGIAISVVNLTTGARGLSLSPPRTAFAENEEITMILSEIDQARSRLVDVSTRFADHAAFIANRLGYLQQQAGTFLIQPHTPTGADAEEPNEEGDIRRPLDLSAEVIEPEPDLLESEAHEPQEFTNDTPAIDEVLPTDKEGLGSV
ncbi:MAG: hypothetical protein WA138_06390 [Parvibaculum sp.]